MITNTARMSRLKIAAIIVLAILCLPVTVALLLASMKETR
jgi:hypothetical protein